MLAPQSRTTNACLISRQWLHAQDAAAQAIEDAIEEECAQIDADALAEIVTITQGYPYFLQEWGKHTWAAAQGPSLTLPNVNAASDQARDALDRNCFRVRFDRLTPREQDYLHAMAQLGAGPLRSGLIRKGMIWKPFHGMTAFTVPMFDTFMRRAMG